MAENNSPGSTNGAALPHFMSPLRGPRHPPQEPPFKPDLAKSHGGANPYEGQVHTKFMEPPKEKEESRFVALEGAESVRYDDEVQQMKEYSARCGFGEVESRFWDDMLNKVQHTEGTSPRDQTRQRVMERLGIHGVSFRPVSALTKTFDDYAELAKVWKQQHGIEDYGVIPQRRVERPSVIGEYINTGAPVTSRSGSNLTSVQREKRDEVQRRRKPEPHLVASYFPEDFDHGPGGEHPSPVFVKHAKASFRKEREMVERLVERLKGKATTYSPNRMDTLSIPVTPEQRAAKAAEAVERSRSRHTDPGSPSVGGSSFGAVSPSSGRGSPKIEGPQRPRYWR